MPENTPTSLIIAGLSIRQDSEGRYCLNDLHKASGGEKRHQPAFFMRLDNIQDIIDEIGQSANMQIAPVSAVRGGKAPGTYACWELVYNYAMWISPKFNLKVVRAYHAMMTGQPVPGTNPMALVPQNLREALVWRPNSPTPNQPRYSLGNSEVPVAKCFAYLRIQVMK